MSGESQARWGCKMTNMRVGLVVRQALGLVGVLLLAGTMLVAQQPPMQPEMQPPPAQGPAPAPGPMMSPQQLDTLVAPIALYPDSLLGQVLAASTYPVEVVEAWQWLQANRSLQGSQLMDAARQQNWDPSVAALVVFPDVLSRLAADVRYTTDLGNAFLAQQADVMNAVQRMRSRAMATGKLNSNAQESVQTQIEGGQPEIEIQPTNPEVVYVPYYDPSYVWGPPAYGYYPAWDYAGFGFGFFPGVYIGGFFGGLGWGGWGWGLNWFHCSLFVNPFFFNHFGFGWHGGFGGYGGFRGGAGWRNGAALWAHDANHRLGASYPNRALNNRFGATSTARAAALGRAQAGVRSFAAHDNQAGGWNRFGETNRGVAPGSSYRSGQTSGSNAYRGSSSFGNSYNAGRNYNAGRSAPSYRSTPYAGNTYRPSYGGNSYGRSAPSYRAPPYGGNQGSVHSYGGSVHSNGGSVHSGGGGGGAARSSGGGGFHGGGGGGGGGFHGGGGG